MSREKMAKRFGNFRTLPDLLAAGYRPSAIRYLLVTGAHYRRTLDWNEESLRAADEAVGRLSEFRDRVRALGEGSGGEAIGERADAAAADFARTMDDDLNVPEAVGHLFAAIRDLNRLLDATSPAAAVAERLAALVHQADYVLGALPLVDRERAGSVLGAEEEELLTRRVAARAARDFAGSDRLRTALLERGIIVEDTPQGQRWKRA